ncbi:MAG: hypothetical protein QXQ14_00120 [Candidatus Aenigmatarchaeota archaeon]
MIEFSIRNFIVIILVLIGLMFFVLIIFSILNPETGKALAEICNLIFGPLGIFCNVFISV